MDTLWTLTELTAEAASVLSDGRSPRSGGRARDLPNERMIRWYVTIGLVDPPLSRRGRVAMYGPRHLLQLVAIKRRQAEGHSLADIQAELGGARDTVLRRIAGLGTTLPGEAGPDEGGAAPHEARAHRADQEESGPRRFWAERAAVPPDGAVRLARGAAPRERSDTPTPRSRRGEDAPERTDPSAPDAQRVPGASLHGMWLAPGAALLLDTRPSPDDAAEIVAAAAPLLDLLTERGLL